MSDSPEIEKPRTRIWKYIPGGVKLIFPLTSLIVVLKLCGVSPMAGWSWLWVLSPFWISMALGILMFVGMFVVYYFFDK
ncbi:hypothetical protein SAMN05428949_6221 [Chitinophaga sp. YR627]|nr:hypothetical protein SAMN05428949_6221 [Chitinophaga sp. YR627]